MSTTTTAHDIRVLTGEAELRAIWPLVAQLRPDFDEDRFVANMARSLQAHGVAIVGSPSLESQLYASPGSKEGHVNCKTGLDLKALMQRHFHNVFLFSMNDEVVHTGFLKMAHYLFALCCSPR